MLKARIGNELYVLHTRYTFFFQFMLCKRHISLMPSSFINGCTVENLKVLVAEAGEKGKWPSNDSLCFTYFFFLIVA